MIWWVVLGAIALVVLIVGLVVVGVVGLIAAPHREAPSLGHVAAFYVSGFVALLGIGAMSNSLGSAWGAVPVVMWLAVVAAIRRLAPERETAEQRKARQAEEKRRAAARRRVAARARADAFGKDGLGLIDRAKQTVDDVMATEAAQDGWLGQPGDLDFSADVTMIADTLRQARRMEKLVAQSKAIPRPTDDDTRMLRDAERAVKQLRGDVKRRVQTLDDCANQARQVDRFLAEEREQARLAKRRDNARRQLSAELYGVEAAPPARPSDATDAVSAHVAAFRELKGIIDEQRQREIDAAIESADSDPPAEPENALTWIRKILPF